jgi:hypothetical protein
LTKTEGQIRKKWKGVGPKRIQTRVGDLKENFDHDIG